MYHLYAELDQTHLIDERVAVIKLDHHDCMAASERQAYFLPQLRQCIETSAKYHAKSIIIDMSEVRHMGSADINALVEVAKRPATLNVEILFGGARPEIYDLLAGMRLNSHMNVTQLQIPENHMSAFVAAALKEAAASRGGHLAL